MPQNGILTQEEGAATLFTGQASVTTGAAALPSQVCNTVAIQNDPASTVPILVGNASGQYIAAVPGDNIVLPVQNLNQIYLKTASGTATANWIARS